MMLKQRLRSQLRLCRQQLTSEAQARYAEQITNHLFHTDFFKQAKHLALYLPFDGEVPTYLILKKALVQHKSCYVPVLAKTQLQFVKIEENTPMIKNRYGILEPSFPFMKLTGTRNLDVVLVPLVAFDKACYRLGMGAGFIDKTFAFKRREVTKPLLIGLAYDFQRVSTVPRNKHDIKLDGVVTEKQLYCSQP